MIGTLRICKIKIFKKEIIGNYKLQLFMKIKNSIVINVATILLEDAIWKYLYKMFIHELNCEHCGKYFTRAFNLWEIFHKIITLNIHIKRTRHEAQRIYNCDYCGKSSIQLGNINEHIMRIYAGQWNYKCVSCGKYITKSASLMNLIKIYPSRTKKSWMWFLWKILYSNDKSEEQQNF